MSLLYQLSNSSVAGIGDSWGSKTGTSGTRSEERNPTHRKGVVGSTRSTPSVPPLAPKATEEP